jgi:hypothetical protein
MKKKRGREKKLRKGEKDEGHFFLANSKQQAARCVREKKQSKSERRGEDFFILATRRGKSKEVKITSKTLID